MYCLVDNITSSPWEKGGGGGEIRIGSHRGRRVGDSLHLDWD